MVGSLESFSNNPVVVNLPIDSKGNALIVVGKRLGTRFNPYNAQTFVGKDCQMLVT